MNQDNHILILPKDNFNQFLKINLLSVYNQWVYDTLCREKFILAKHLNLSVCGEVFSWTYVFKPSYTHLGRPHSTFLDYLASCTLNLILISLHVLKKKTVRLFPSNPSQIRQYYLENLYASEDEHNKKASL